MVQRASFLSGLLAVTLSSSWLCHQGFAQNKVEAAVSHSLSKTTTASTATPPVGPAASLSAAGSKPLTGNAVHNDDGQKTLTVSVEQIQKAEAAQLGKYRSGWTMYLQNPCHTGSTGAEATLPQGHIGWTFPAEGPIDSSPAVFQGVVYVGSDDGNLYAVDEKMGSMLWHTKLGDKVTLVGFGTFERRMRKARTGRNPRTLAPLKIAAARVPAFRAGKELKDIVNGRAKQPTLVLAKPKAAAKPAAAKKAAAKPAKKAAAKPVKKAAAKKGGKKK